MDTIEQNVVKFHYTFSQMKNLLDANDIKCSIQFLGVDASKFILLGKEISWPSYHF